MNDNENLKSLYNTLQKEGYTPPAFEQFAKDMEDDGNLRGVYSTLQNEGYTPPDYDTFRSDMGFGKVAKTNPRVKVGSHAQMVVDEYNRAAKAAGAELTSNNEKSDSEAINEANEPNRTDNPNKTNEPVTPRMQFVPEYANVKGFTVSKDSPLRQQYPFLDQLGEDEQAYFKTDTNEPLYAWKDSEGKDITPDEAATLNQRADIEQNDAIRPRQVPVTSLQLPDDVKSRGIRTDMKMTEYIDGRLKEQYGYDYLNRQITLNDGMTVSGDEMLGKVSQQVYDNLNKQINEARVTYVGADNVGRKRIINQFVNNYKGLLSEATVKRALEEQDALQEATSESKKRERAEWAQMKEDNPGFWQTLKNSIGAGIINFGAGLLDTMQELSSGLIVEDPSKSGGYMRTRSYEDALADKNDPLTIATNMLHGKSEQLSKSAQPYKGKKGFLDMLWDGEITEFLQKGVATAGESLPMTLSAFNPYTMAINAISMAGSNFRQNTLDNPNIPAWKRAMQAIGSAAIEQAVEKYSDPIFKYVGGNKVLRGVSKENSEKIVTDITEEAVNTLYGRIFNRLKGLTKDAAGEGVEEVMTDAGNDLLGETLDLVSGSTDYGLRAQWDEFKEDNPNADLKTFAKNKAKEYVEDFIGGAMAGAYTSSTAQLSAKALQYSFDKIGGAQNQGDPTRLNPVQVDIAQSYDDGYNAESGEVAEMTDNYNRQRLKVESTFSPEIVTEIDNDPISLLDSGSINGEDMQTVIDYVNAKARYDGIMQRNSDDAETGIDHRNLHSDGMIHTALLYPTAENGGEPQEVFITKGNVVMRGDGTIDTEASSNAIYYKGSDGQVHMTSPDKIQSVNEPISIEEYAAAGGKNEPNMPNELNTTEGFAVGDEVNVNIDDEQAAGEITGITEDGLLIVSYETPDGTISSIRISPDELRNMNRPNDEQPPIGGAGAVVENAEPNGTNEPNASQTAEDRMPIDVSEYFGNAEEAMATAKDIIQNGEVIGTLPDGSVQMQKDGFVATLMPDGNGGMNVTGIERTGNNAPQNIPENGNIGAKNIQQTDGISTENGGISAENIQQEQQIPQDDEGNLIYDQVPVETTIADLYDGSLNDEEVQGFIDANIADAQKKYDSVQKKTPKIGTNKAKYLEQKRKWQADVDEAKRVLDYWHEVNSQKQALTHTTEEETQAAQAELSGQNAREEFNQYNENGVNDAVSVASDFIRGAKITPESFRAETGYGTGEQRRFVGMIASEQNGGKSIDRLAEELVSYDNAELNGVTFNGDTGAAKDAILEALQSAGTRGELTTDNTAENERYVEARRAELDAQCMEAYGMTYEDYLAYEERMMPEMLRKYANFDEVEFYNLYADEIEQSLNARINEQGNDTAGEEPRTGGGNEVLPGEGIGNARGSEGSTEQGAEVPAGVQGTVEDGTVPERTSEDRQEGRSVPDRTEEVESATEGLTSEDADNLLSAMEARAEVAPDIELTPTNWVEQFGEDGMVDTPIGKVKMGENQIAKLFTKGRSSQFGMIRPTLTNPDVIVEVPSSTDNANNVERPTSLLFIKTFLKNDGSKVYYFKSVTVKKDGLEVSVSSHLDRKKRVEDALRKGKLQYRFDGGAQTEHRPADVSVTTPLAGQGASSKGNATIGDQSVSDMENGTLVSPQLASSGSKDTQTSANEQTVSEKIAQEEAKVEQNPTEAQKEAGNYKKGHIKIDGYDVTIENPKGSVRSGVDRNGQEWSVTMNNTYGYIRGTEGVDGDHIDVYLSDNPTEGNVFVIDQVNSDGSFDEHKVMYGFNSAEEARDAYLANYSPGWHGLGTITEVTKDEFKKWVGSSHRKTKPFAEYKSVKKEVGQNEGENNFKDKAENLWKVARFLNNNYGYNFNDEYSFANWITKKKNYKNWLNDKFAPWQVKDVIKAINEYVEALNNQNNDNESVRFREAEDDGSKSLVGVHNITEDKLVKAIRQGGFANPSVAVIDADRQTHEGYGEISLIMPSNKINRRTGRNAGTFTNDAWTPMYPQIERQFGKGGSERAAQDIESVAEEMRSEVRQGINSWMDGRNGIGLEYLFLHERNEAPLTVRVEPVYPERLRNEVAEIMNGKDSFMDLDEAERQSIVNLLVRERYDGDSAKYTDEIKQRIKHDEERIAKRPNSLFSRRVKMDVDFMKEYGYDYSEAKSFVDAIVEDGRTAGTTDTRATLTAAQSAIAERGLQEEYDKWLDGLNDRYNINEVIFDGFTPSGNRRYVPNTLENVSRLMKKNGRNGATGLGTSFSNFAASVLKAKGTLNDIRKMKGNLTSEHKNVDEFREKWGNVFYELGNKLQPDATGFEDYGLARLAEAATQKNPRKYIKDEYGIEMSDDDVKKLDDMIRAIRENYPAMYFETKFERPVYFNEFTAAVVPNNIKPSTRKTLEDAGLKLFEYDPNMEGDRQRIFNEATREEGVRFRSDENLFNNDGLLTRNGIDTAVADIANKLNIGVRVSHSIDEVNDEGVRRAIEKGRNVKGWYDTSTGEMVVYAPNAVDADDAVRTVLHEGVAHYGLRQLVGEENFDTFLDNIYNNVDGDIKATIDGKAQRNGWSTRVATEEYLASLAEDTNFEEAKKSGLWQKIKDFFTDLLTKAGVRLNEALTDNELRYLLWRSYENLQEPNGRGTIGTVKDVAMQGRLGVGNYGNEDVRLRETEEEQAPEKKSENKYRELYDRRVSKKTARLNRSYFDSMQPVKVLQKTITEETGQQIRPEENVYLQENRANSMAQRKHEMWERGHMELARREVTKLMQQIMGGNWLTRRFKLPKTRRNAYNAVVRYMKSKHELENNEYRRNMEAEAAREPFEAEIGAVEKLVKDGNISRAEADKRQAELKEQADKAETASRAKTLNKDYSGLQGIYGKEFERKAKEYVEDFEGAYDTKLLWREWNGATKAILEEEYKSGLLSKELYDRIRKMYKYYIPLKGWAENRAEDVYTYYATGSGDGGKPHRREGRTSESDDPLVTLEQDADRQFTAAARNRTKQALYNLATAHKSSLLTVRRQWYQNIGTKENPDWQRKDPEIPENATPEQMEQIIKDFEKDMRKLEKEGTAMRQRKPMILPYHPTKSMEKEHTVRVMVNGKEYVIYVNGNPAAAQAVNGTSTPQDPDGSVLKRIYGSLRWINRVKASLLTAVNVNFIPSNLVRDAQYSIQNMKAKEPVGYVLKYVKNLGEGMAKMTSARLFYKDKKGTLNMDDKTERLFKEFLDNGGETGYTARYTLEKQWRRNMAAINRMTGIDWLAGLRMLQHSLEYVNRSVETIVRFAAYKTSREAGRSIAQSINDAKEASVNFDKHGSGELGNKEWRLAYIFSNVGFQALRRLLENASGHKVRFTLAQIERFALGFAVPMMAKALLDSDGDDDEKDAYEALPEWMRESGLALPVSPILRKAGADDVADKVKRVFLYLPLGPEDKIWYALGENAWHLFNKGEMTVEDEKNMALKFGSLAADLLPLDFQGYGSNPIVSLAPTPVQDFVALKENVNYWGQPIYRESTNYNEYDPGHRLAFIGTPEWYVKRAEDINRLTGGDEYTKGWLSPKPEQIEYFINQTGGGVTRVVNQVMSLIERAGEDGNKDIQILKNVPVISSLAKKADVQDGQEGYDREKYYDYIDEYEKALHDYNAYRKAKRNGDNQAGQKAEELKESPTGERMDIIRKDIRKIRNKDKQVRKIDEKENPTAEEEARRDKLKTESNELKQKLLEKLDKVKEKPGKQ